MKILTKQEIFPALKQLVSQAKEEILIVSPWVKGEVLEQLLSEKKGINIEILIRSSKLEDLIITDPYTFDVIQKYNGRIYLNPDLHSKFVIVDNKKAIVGSANITRAGLLEKGNIETAVLVESKTEIKKLKDYYHKIKDSSIDIQAQVFGFILNAINSREAEALLIKKIPEQTYIKIPINQEAFYLGRISVIKSINLGLLSSFANTLFKNLLTKTEEIKQVFSGENELWQSSALLSYLYENSESFYIANIEILAEFNPKKIKEKESILKTPLEPPKAGTLILSLKKEEEIKNILKINHAGYEMGTPVEFGRLFNTDIPVFIDLDKITTMHMAVLGTTGSGKTTFIRRVLEHLHVKNIKVFIFDLYGEYYNSLKIDKSLLKHIVFQDVLFPVTAEDMKETLKQEGVILQEKSNEEKRVISLFREYFKPDINIIAFKQKNLEDILIEAIDLTDASGSLRKDLIEFRDILKRNYGENTLLGQQDVVKKIIESFDNKESIVIYNLNNIIDAKSRVNIAGITMKELFRRAKEIPEGWMVVLEEAQNFAPEKGFGDIPASSENISYVMAKKIATEGRKFNLGLIAITQRPANISKYVLSQLNTQAIFKLINRNDLDAVSVFFEFSKEDVYALLPFLKPGSVFITGLAVPFGLLAEIELG